MEEYKKMKNYKWTFYGKSRTKARFSKEGTRTAFLLNPTNSSPILAAIKHQLPKELRSVNAFDDPTITSKIVKLKLNLALMSSSKTPTLKEKLFSKQKGVCSICSKVIDPDYLYQDGTHIHHIEPIKKGGNKFALRNLALTHS